VGRKQSQEISASRLLPPPSLLLCVSLAHFTPSRMQRRQQEASAECERKRIKFHIFAVDGVESIMIIQRRERKSLPARNSFTLFAPLLNFSSFALKRSLVRSLAHLLASHSARSCHLQVVLLLLVSGYPTFMTLFISPQTSI
jgi:hypothetical protein